MNVSKWVKEAQSPMTILQFIRKLTHLTGSTIRLGDQTVSSPSSEMNQLRYN